MYYFRVSESQECKQLNWVLCIGGSHRLQSGCGQGLQTHLQVQLEKHLLPSSLTWLLADFRSSRVVGLRASISLTGCWPEATPVPSQVGLLIEHLATWQSEQIRSQAERTPARGRGLGRQKSQFLYLILEVIQHHFIVFC